MSASDQIATLANERARRAQSFVSGYLPRNNAVPMYNEPPGIRSGYGFYGR